MSDKKRILIVGGGSIGLKHVAAFQAVEAPPEIAVVDPRPEARARAADMGAEDAGSAWELLDLSQFSGVVVCAPAPMHIPYALRCLREGIPVLSEKPLSHNWEGVQDLVDLASRPGSPASGVAYVRRYHPAHEAAREYLASCVPGTPLVVRVNCGQPFTKYRPDYRSIYFSSRDQGGGCVLDFASHFVDLIQWYVGIMDVLKGLWGHLALEGVEVEDTVALSFSFRQGRGLGTLNINQYQPLNENMIEFASPQGVMRITEPDFRCRFWGEDAEEWVDIPAEPDDYRGALRRQAGAFLAAMDGGPPMRTQIAEAARTLALCLEVLESGTAR